MEDELNRTTSKPALQTIRVKGCQKILHAQEDGKKHFQTRRMHGLFD